MLKGLTYSLAAMVLLVACDPSPTSIGGLGGDFTKAFAQDRNATPLDPSDLTLVLTPTKEPFNP